MLLVFHSNLYVTDEVGKKLLVLCNNNVSQLLNIQSQGQIYSESII